MEASDSDGRGMQFCHFHHTTLFSPCLVCVRWTQLLCDAKRDGHFFGCADMRANAYLHYFSQATGVSARRHLQMEAVLMHVGVDGF